MKKAVTIIAAAIIIAVTSFVIGATTVLHADGWVDFDRGQFVIEWMNNIWTWDISEG